MSTTRRTSKKQKAAPVPTEPVSISVEGFSDSRTPHPNNRYGGLPLSDSAWVCNGNVRAYRYRVTVERIDEPREVIVARLVSMYNVSKNHHEHTALSDEAARLGIESLNELARAAKAQPLADADMTGAPYDCGAEGHGDPWTDGAA